MPEWTLKPGELIKRKELHDRFGGERQSGVSPSSQTPNVFLFTDPTSGEQHGYEDIWVGDIFHYTAKGKTGDQQMIGGNARILRHRETGDALRLFKGAGGAVQYVGEFELDDPPWYPKLAPASGGGETRQVIVFRLRQARPPMSTAPVGLSRRYVRPNENPSTREATPFFRDPDAIDRSLAAHARTQNALHDFLRRHHIQSWSPSPDEPDYDLGWVRKEQMFVAEVKSLPAGEEAKQLEPAPVSWTRNLRENRRAKCPSRNGENSSPSSRRRRSDSSLKRAAASTMSRRASAYMAPRWPTG